MSRSSGHPPDTPENIPLTPFREGGEESKRVSSAGSGEERESGSGPGAGMMILYEGCEA
ncbi:hypothetical protein ASZ90_015170 [hydrocarbon metagenome]|uniref:Uncharacterized protein n=1 Tax=hydrocarbon metagenome TaxID=938273 RepID=A0A0W8F2U5_9ZZZZ